MTSRNPMLLELNFSLLSVTTPLRSVPFFGPVSR